MSTQDQTPSNPTPNPTTQPPKRKKKSGLDLVTASYFKHPDAILVLRDSTFITGIPIDWTTKFTFWLQGHLKIEKLACIGSFSPSMILAASRGGPQYDIPVNRQARRSHMIFQNIQIDDLVGTVCSISLVNGWSFVGFIKRCEPHQLAFICEHNQPDGNVLLLWAKIYIHAIATLNIIHPRGVHPDSLYWTEFHQAHDYKRRPKKPKMELRSTAFMHTPFKDDEDTRRRLITRFLFHPDKHALPSTIVKAPPPQPPPGYFSPRNPPPQTVQTPQAAPSPQSLTSPPSPEPPPSPPSTLKPTPVTPPSPPPSPKPITTQPKTDSSPAPSPWTIISNTPSPERTVVNAKLKIVLRSLPTFREAGDVIWLPLQNEPKPLPKNLDLAPSPLDLVVTKKMWTGIQKKAAAIKASGQDPIYVFEALIGIRSGRLAAIASGVQVTAPKSTDPSP